MNACLTKDILYDIRIEFRKNVDIKSSYLAESIASSYGYKTSISMLEDIKKKNVPVNDINYFSFIERLKDFYPDIKANEVIPVLMKIIKQRVEGLQNLESASIYGLYKKHIENNNKNIIIVNGQAYMKTPEYLDQKNRRCINLWSNNDDAPLKYIIETGQVEKDSAFYLDCHLMGYLFDQLYRYDTYPLSSIEYSVANLDISKIIDIMFSTDSYCYKDKTDWEMEILRSRIQATFKKIQELLDNHNIVDSLAPFVSPVSTYMYELVFNTTIKNMTKADIIDMVACNSRSLVLYSNNKENSSFINEKYWFYIDILLVYLFINMSVHFSKISPNIHERRKVDCNEIFKVKTFEDINIFSVSDTGEYPEYLIPIISRFNSYKQIMKERNLSLLDVLNLLIGRKQENIETLNFLSINEMVQSIREAF